jgi:hypothetical protein
LAGSGEAGFPAWVRWIAKGELIKTLVERVADVLLAMLLGVVVLPGSSNSTVKGKFWEGGVMVEVMLVAETVAVFSTCGDAQGVFTLLPLLGNPVGKVPALMHH